MSEFSGNRRSFSLQSSQNKWSDDVAPHSDPPVWPGSTKSPVPTSSLLQDLVREKKAQTRRLSRIYEPNGQRSDGQGATLDTRVIQSSPLAPTTTRDRGSTKERRTSTVGGRDASAPKEMGVREMEQYVSKINKQNFDLKLELFHRRQKTEALEAKLEKLETLKSDNQELNEINADLLFELEKRDAAVKEAVARICYLEAKIEEMEPLLAGVLPYTTMPDRESQPLNEFREPLEQPLSPVDAALPTTPSTTRILGSRKDSQAPRSPFDESVPRVETPPRRTPSFLKGNEKSTQALRSLYSSDGYSTPGNQSVFSLPRAGSLFSADEKKPEADPDNVMGNSPRLSMLSESSFLSVYGKTKESDVISAKKTEPRSFEESSSEDEHSFQDPKQQKPNIDKWINESDKIAAPNRRFAKDRQGDNFSSIDEMVDNVPSETQSFHRPRQMSPRSHSHHNKEESAKFQPLPPLGGAIFGHGVLPPTPDTMSTSNIEAISTATSIITEKSVVDGAPFGINNHHLFAPEERPLTAESSGDPSKLGSTPIFDEKSTVIKSDGEHESTQVAQSDAGEIWNPQVPHQVSTFTTGSFNAKRQVSAVPVRPLLTSYATDMMFNGEGYDSVQPARTMSYPSPAEGKRRRSVQFPPAGQEAFEIPKTVNEFHSTRSRASGKSTILSPKRERLGASPTGSSSDSRGGESLTVSETENSERRQSSSLRLKSLFGFKHTSPSAKSGANLGESPLSEVQSMPSSTSHNRRPSSVYLQHSSKPLPNPPATRIARPSSARDPNYSQFGTARRYSHIPDAVVVHGAKDENSATAEPEKESAEPVGEASLPYGKASPGGVVHRKTDSESRPSIGSMGADEAAVVAGRKWGIGIGRNASARMKEGLNGLRNRPK